MKGFPALVSLVLALATSMPAAAQTGQWILAPRETSGSNLWVNVALDRNFLDQCDGNCPWIDIYLAVSPCPVAARIYVPNQTDPVDLGFVCSNGVATFTRGYLSTYDPRLDLLLAPGTYRFDGRTFAMFYRPEITGDPCGEIDCTFDAHYGPTTFDTTTLPVSTTTWGAIKALYRN